MIPKIIWEDSDLLVVEKPSGIATQPLRVGNDRASASGGRPYTTLAEKLSVSYPEIKSIGGSDWGAVHRLDIETSGLVIFARNQEMYDRLREMFSKNEIEKEYTALVTGQITKPGKINWPIGSDPKSKKRVKIYKNRKEAIRGKAQEAITSYEPHVGAQFIAPGDKSRPYTLLHIQIKTGRRHQIRAHLATFGHPIVGDELYGKSIGGIEKQGAMNCAPTFLYLHASRLKFRHPRTGQMVEVASVAPFALGVREDV